MKINFTKMQGAGNDFVVLDETQTRFNLSKAQYQHLADRHFGVGADQILTVRSASSPDVDFDYVIHNADGGEVEHCGNGARCFVRFVRERGLTTKTSIKVRTKDRVLTLNETPDGQVTVDMGVPIFEHTQIPYIAPSSDFVKTKLPWDFVLSMGNPHAVVVLPYDANLDDMDIAPHAQHIQQNPAFPRGVNVGFMQVINRFEIKLRVYERGAGETLACGTGACAAVVAGNKLGLLEKGAIVHTRGGNLQISLWESETDWIMMTGPAETVYQGTIEI